MMKIDRLFSCKSEELLPLSKFTLFSLKRDIAEFAAFSTKFNDEYVTQTEAMINTVENLLEPQAEVLTLGMIAQTMDAQLNDIILWLQRIEGYLKLSKSVPSISAAGFGISALRRSVRYRDYEGVVAGMKVLVTNVQNHLTVLQAAGMPDTVLPALQELHTGVAGNRQKQFEIRSKRAALVQDNMKTLNELYLRMTEIYSIGKVLYRTTDPAKYAEYTFSKLLKKVRNAARNAAPADDNAVATNTNTTTN